MRPMIDAVLVAIAAGMTGLAAAPEQERVAGWRSDLDHLVAQARQVHAGPTRPAHGSEFASAVAQLKRRVPELPDHRIVVEIQRLLALLGDGHSLVYPMPTARAPFLMLPLDVYLFEDGLFIVDASGPATELVGSRIAKFGALTTGKVLQRMEPYVSRDNSVALKVFVSLYAVMPAFLEAWGATDDPTRATMTVTDAQGVSREVTLIAGPPHRIRRRLFPPAGSAQPVPMYLQHADRNYFLRALPEHGAVYFQLNQVADAPDLPLSGVAGRLREMLASVAAESLIVDVRHNNGGNNQLLEPLLQTIEAFAAGPGKRRVYVITSRGTFSAAQNFINRIERRVKGAVFAGEPSMSSPNFTGEDNPIVLPFSGVTVSVSNRHWQDSDAGDRRPWIAPQIPVTLSSREWLDNADPALEAILRAIADR